MIKKSCFYISFLLILTGCNNDEDIRQFEKDQAQLTTRLKEKYEKKKDPCVWTGIGAGCKVISFGDQNNIYVIETPQGDVMTTKPSEIYYFNHNKFSHYKEEISHFLAKRGFGFSLKAFDYSRKRFIHMLEEGYVLMVDIEDATIIITENGTIKAVNLDERYKRIPSIVVPVKRERNF